MRTMRHTCITLNHDASVPRELIRAITAVTADQAAAALDIRLRHEGDASARCRMNTAIILTVDARGGRIVGIRAGPMSESNENRR